MPGPVGGWLEVDPPVAGEVDLDPAVAVQVAHHVHSRVAVVLARRVAGGQARGHANRPQHYRHGGGVVVAVAGLRLEQEVVHAVRARGGRVDALGIDEPVAAQELLNRYRLVQRSLGVYRDALGQVAYSLRQVRRQGQVVVPDEAVVVGAGFPQVVVGRHRDVRDHGVWMVAGQRLRKAPRNYLGGDRLFSGDGYSLDRPWSVDGCVPIGDVLQHEVGRQIARYERLLHRRHRAVFQFLPQRLRQLPHVFGKRLVGRRVEQVERVLLGCERLQDGAVADPVQSAARKESPGLEVQLEELLHGLALEVVHPRRGHYLWPHLYGLRLARDPARGGVLAVGPGDPVGRIVGLGPEHRLTAERDGAQEGQRVSEQAAGQILARRDGREQPRELALERAHGGARRSPHAREGRRHEHVQRQQGCNHEHHYAEHEGVVDGHPAVGGLVTNADFGPLLLLQNNAEPHYQQDSDEGEEEEAG